MLILKDQYNQRIEIYFGIRAIAAEHAFANLYEVVFKDKTHYNERNKRV